MVQRIRNKDYFLWKRFKDGDDEAFYWLYDQNIDALYSFGTRISKDTEFVKDCIHDLFLDLYKYRHQLSDTDSIRFYLFRSLRRKIHKRGKRLLSIMYNDDMTATREQVVPGAEKSIVEQETKDENHMILGKAMEKLTQHQKEALFLKFDQNLSYPEIADLLGISVESVRTNIYRALKTLRECIQKENPSFYLILFGKIFPC